MAARNVVSIFQVEADGSTGERIATGTLIHPLLILVHEPHDSRLDDNKLGRLRAGVTATSIEGPSAVEVIDGVRVRRVLVDPARDPILTLDLVHPADTSVEPLTEELSAADLLRLASAPDLSGYGSLYPGMSDDPGGPDPSGPRPWVPGPRAPWDPRGPWPPDHPACRLFPWICKPTGEGGGGEP
jgi:hypothetical protein